MKNIIQATSVSTKEELIRIGVATTPEEKREVYRFRYTIYAEEIGYDLADADHQNKLLYDDWDGWGILLFAKVGSTMIATTRINIGKITDFHPRLIQEYRMDEFRKFYSKKDNPYFGIISKGAILPKYRSTLVFCLLAAKLYELYFEYQLQFVFGSCNFHLISMYEHLGNRRIDKNTSYPDTGTVSSLVMLIDDVQHLRTVGSPLFRAARKRTVLNDKAVAWFNSKFSNEIKTTVNSRLVTVDELWTIICQYLDNMPNQTMPILKGLSISEAKVFLHYCGTIVHCHPGDYITANGDISQEVIVLLSGITESSLHGNILPGQYCGNNGLVHRSMHSSSVIAVGDVNILVLSFYNFSNFKKRNPDIADKIINNLL